MNKILSILLLLFTNVFCNIVEAQDCDFTAVSPSGHSLCYKLIHNDKQVAVFAKDKPQGRLIIPDSVEYFGKVFAVTEIKDWAFYECTSLSSVILPSTIERIGNYAFERCKSLNSIDFPVSLHSIGYSAFEECESIKTIEIPLSINMIGSYAFRNCKALTKLTILPSVIAYCASDIFPGCYNIKELYINEYVNVPMANVRKITLGETFTFLSKDGDFANLHKLEEVVIGDGLSQIKDNCFNNCENLRVVTIGKHVNFINSNAFRKCVSLDTIYALPTTAPYIDSSSFIFTKPTKVVVTKCESDYAEKWGTTEFQYYTEGLHTISVSSSCESCGRASISQSVDCGNIAIIEAVPFDKYVFKQWNDGNTDNPRTITLERDMELNAEFYRVVYDIRASSSNSTMGKVQGNGSYNLGERVSLTAYAECGYRFKGWSNGSISNPIIIVPTSDTNLTAYFEVAIDTIYIPDTTLEKVIVYDTTIVPIMLYDTNRIEVKLFDTICAIVYSLDSIRFNREDTLHIHDLPAFHDTIYINDPIVTGIREVDLMVAKVYADDGYLVVEGVVNENVILYNIRERLVVTQVKENNGRVQFEVPTQGTYLVKIGNHPAKKIVVIK